MAHRVHPRSYAFLTELSKHQADGGPAQERQCVPVEAFPIFSQSATPVEPADGSLDDPALGQHDELARVRALDDLQIDLAANALQSELEFRPLIAAIGIELEQKRKHAKQRAHQQYTAIAVLNIGGMDDGAKQ
jgi:hypothetical protein